MKPELNNRRTFIKKTAGAVGLVSLPGILRADNADNAAPMKVVCVGGHPDDPESGCGGTLARLSAAGHQVTIIYLTTGEAGIPGKSHQEAAAIRRKEAIEGCKILKAKPVFAGQIDGATIVNQEWRQKLQDLLLNEKPDLVFTHWPIDTHPDHQAASLLTMQAWVRAKQQFPLYFFEVCAGEQTMTFHPTDLVDITEFSDVKRKVLFCHTSQDPDGIYACGHAAMEDFRGRQLGVHAAEGFVRMNGRGQSGLQNLLASL